MTEPRMKQFFIGTCSIKYVTSITCRTYITGNENLLVEDIFPCQLQKHLPTLCLSIGQQIAKFLSE